MIKNITTIYLEVLSTLSSTLLYKKKTNNLNSDENIHGIRSMVIFDNLSKITNYPAVKLRLFGQTIHR